MLCSALCRKRGALGPSACSLAYNQLVIATAAMRCRPMRGVFREPERFAVSKRSPRAATERSSVLQLGLRGGKVATVTTFVVTPAAVGTTLPVDFATLDSILKSLDRGD